MNGAERGPGGPGGHDRLARRPRQIVDGGVASLLVPSDDPAVLAEVIVRRAGDSSLRRLLRERGLERVTLRPPWRAGCWRWPIRSSEEHRACAKRPDRQDQLKAVEKRRATATLSIPMDELSSICATVGLLHKPYVLS